MSAEAVTVTEVRVLEGPNLYFTRPSIKVSLECPGYLAAQEQELRELGRRLGLRGVRPGAPDSDQRQRFLMRLVAHVVRLVAHGSGTTRLAVRTRTGGSRDQVVVAFPWRWRGRGIALGESLGLALGALVDGSPTEAEEGIQAAVALVAAAERGARPVLVTPRIPVASITGTNGKTTTTRLLAHIGMTAGLTTAWSSTDGVLVQGRVLEDGDYSGPAGARAVLAAPGVQLGILETARGGMLLKGMGVSANDVSVVTNVSADHLGLQGIDTVDQLAEVKAIVTRATKPAGWVVLNGDDPRAWAMRAGARGRPWAFSLDPDSPARIAHARGSSPLSTTHPAGLVARVTMALTSASWSTVSMPCRPRWSADTLVTTLTSLADTPMPLSSIPPRAVSRMPSWTPGAASTARAPAGPE